MGCGGYQDEGPSCRAVVMVVPTLGKRCGISDYSRSLARELTRLGLDVKLVPFEPAGLYWEGQGAPSGQALRPGTIAHFQYQYVLYDIEELRLVLGRLRRAGIPFVATVHEFSPAYQEYNRFLLGEFDGIIVHSALMRDLICGTCLGCSGSPEMHGRPRVKMVPMGCEVVPGVSREAARAHLGIAPGEFALGFFGFMLPHKGIPNLIKAFVMLKERYPRLKCFIFAPEAPYVSSRNYGAVVASEIERLGLGPRLSLVRDYLPDAVVVKNLSAMDVVVLPYEDRGVIGVSSAMRTVMSAGCPAVVTDTPFFHDLSAEVVKIKTGSPGDIAIAVSRILDNRGLREDLARKVAEFVARNSWARSAEKHLGFYRGVTRGEAARSEVTHGAVARAEAVRGAVARG